MRVAINSSQAMARAPVHNRSIARSPAECRIDADPHFTMFFYNLRDIRTAARHGSAVRCHGNMRRHKFRDDAGICQQGGLRVAEAEGFIGTICLRLNIRGSQLYGAHHCG